jgi:hypothetical protein
MILSNATTRQARSAKRAVLVFLLLCLPVSLTAGIGGDENSAPRLTVSGGPEQAHVTSRAIARVAGDSTPSRLRAYRAAVERMDRLTRLHARAGRSLARLDSMSDPERRSAFPGGGYDAALAAARATHADLARQLEQAETTRRASLHGLTGGRPLPPGDLAALHRMLGL